MRFKNQFRLPSTKKWDLLRGENLSKFGSRYPDYNELHEYIADGLVKNWVCLTNGAEEAVRICLSEPSFIRRVYFTPTWGLVSVFNNIYGKEIVEIPIQTNREAFYYNLRKLESNLTGNKELVYIATPNANTGSICEVGYIVDLLSRYPDTTFIIDETYFEFNDHQSVLDFVWKFDNLVVIRSYSKARGLAANRFGYYVTQDKRFINLRPASPCSIDTIPLVYKADKNYRQAVELIQLGKNYVEDWLKKEKCKVFDVKTNFIVFEPTECIREAFERKVDFHYVTVEYKKYIKITALPIDMAVEFVNDIYTY